MPERGFVLKVPRARLHLKGLNEAADGWLNGEHHSIRTQRDRDAPDYLTWLARADKPPDDPFSLIVGDCLHNLRSALDLLAYDLAVAHTGAPLPQDIAEDSEFPIFGDTSRKGRTRMGANMFRDAGKPKIRGADPRAQAVIERMQPYQRGAQFTLHPLWTLHEFDRVNKHRLLHPVVAAVIGAMLAVDTNRNVAQMILDYAKGRPGGSVIRVGGGRTVAESETNVLSCPWPPEVSQAEMEANFKPVFKIVLQERAADPKQESITETLEGILGYIESTVVPRLAPFLP